MKDKTKKLALECILLSMEEIKGNLKVSMISENVQVNVEAMKTLAEAYKIISDS